MPTGIKIGIIVFNSSPDVIIKTDKSSHEIVIKIVNRISGRPADIQIGSETEKQDSFPGNCLGQICHSCDSDPQLLRYQKKIVKC